MLDFPFKLCLARACFSNGSRSCGSFAKMFLIAREAYSGGESCSMLSLIGFVPVWAVVASGHDGGVFEDTAEF